jgi:ribonucleoside-diphosphate reductase alpha chain
MGNTTKPRNQQDASAAIAEAAHSAGPWRDLYNSLSEVELTENALKVLCARYLRRNESGEVIETPKDMLFRVAKTIAEPEAKHGATEEQVIAWAGEFYKIMAERQFLPNSPTLMNAGREMGMLSACFVLPVGDSIDEIFDSVKATALIQKAGGGTGFAFDALRPTGDYISSSGGTTSGPISFWKVFSEATNAIQQGAFRRGANMGMMSIEHPDILKFIHAKQDLSRFTNYNISVKFTDDYMEKLRENPDQPHVVKNPRTTSRHYLPRDLDVEKYQIQDLPRPEDVQNPVSVDKDTGEVENNFWTIGGIFDVIIDNAWRTGEPGAAFIDRINEVNPTPHIGRMEATNPCGEQPLLPFEACNLGSINLCRFVDGGSDGDAGTFDWDALRACVETSTRFLDNVVDANRYPLPEIKEMCLGNRKIGLGVMGFADAMFRLGIRYDSPEGVAFGEKVMKFVNDQSHQTSEELALDRGNFPNWEGSIWDTEHQRPMRNATCTTVAPTGTISIIAGCSSGIEPLFSLAFHRNVLDGARLVEVHEYFKQVAQAQGFHSERLMEQLAENGTLQHMDGVPEGAKHTFVCAHDIAPEWHIKMQSAYQHHVDSSISKTTNFPASATREDVRTVYQMAYDYRLKGVTVYRDGCRENQPMALNEKKTEEAPVAAPVEATLPVVPVKTPAIISAVRIRQRTPFGHMHLNLSVDPQAERELEVFAQLGKGGDVAASDLEAICRMVSLFLRCGGSIGQVVDQLAGIGSHLSVPGPDGRVMSLGDGIAKAIQKYLDAKEAFGLKKILLGEVDLDQMPVGDEKPTPVPHKTSSKRDRQNNAYKLACPDCGTSLIFEEGCVKCHGCGYGKC